ncbi:GAF and ANTAR domain-containing protein [Rathayibacter sp. SD072]|uniref:GAF and ANTAR domain-containing protein n=1 Tax=Rathayibacter sp. SD072 TaxID=2781731 RepID=UPI001A95A006|nr:GAF and ANTAR domain-containing protein [Rathayibacter sp. SD072]MBO0982791.1 GAF and ANTAR domain-containing protein [Rathayibacter sp. SD072]
MTADSLARLSISYTDDFPVRGAAISTIGSSFGGETVSATDDVAARLDEIQLDLGEGPCWEASRRRTPVLVVDVRAEADRWPLFSAEAGRLPLASVYAFPLRIAGLDVGVVDLYNVRAAPLSTADIERIRSRSPGTALRVVAQVLTDDAGEASANVHSRRLVHQATGMILARHGITADESLLLLRAHAFAQGRPVSEVAEEIVDRRTGFPPPPLEI